MSIPLDRLYHYIEDVAQSIRNGDVLIYRFFPYGSKKLEDLSIMTQWVWKRTQTSPQIFCYDQEPLNYNAYQIDAELSNEEYYLKYLKPKPANLRYTTFNIYDKCLLLHSELNSTEIEIYQNNGFIPVYYWSHAIIARDWFRYAQHQQQYQHKQIKKTFLIYNRAWSGTREYRLKFTDLLIQHNLISICQTTCNSIEPELQIHYSQYQYINPLWQPTHRLEDYAPPTTATSCFSADFDLNDYNQTDFEVVLETLFDDSRIQLTEKILRPIACGHPFLLLGTPGSLDYLKRYGFKTFSNIINEDYDKITNPQMRMQAIVDVMLDIANWSVETRNSNMIKLKKITEYNRQHFFSKEFFDFVVDELKQNLETGLTELETTNTSHRYLSLRKELLKNPTCKKILTQNNLHRTRSDMLKALKLARNYHRQYLLTTNKY
jgi:hypothetical protein